MIWDFFLQRTSLSRVISKGDEHTKKEEVGDDDFTDISE